MRFAILGPTQVWDGDRPVELGPARRRLVLAALLVDAGRVVPTEVLLDRVWDGRPSDSSLGTLHTYISRLRSALAGAAEPVRLVTSPRGYVLEVSDDDVDARLFTTLLGSAARLRESGDLSAARREVGQALALWRGPAYADFEAEFARLEATRLHDLRLSAHELAAELDLAEGRPGDVVSALTPLVAAEPLREPLRASLVLALYRAGRQADALASYVEGRERLVEELGLDPGPALQDLHQRILRQDPGLDLVTPPGRVAVTSTPRPAETTHGEDTSADRLIGREAPLAELAHRFVAAAGGASQVVAVVGEAGIGKSRLVEEATTRARATGTAVVWGRCWRHEGAPAFWPWAQVLRELSGRLPDEVLEQALSGPGAAVVTLVPELDRDRAHVPITMGSVEHLETQVFDGVLTFVGVASSYRSLVVVLDDLQWADPASRRLTQYAAQLLREVPVTIVATIRSPGQDETHPDLEVLAELSRVTAVTRIDLAPLTTADVQALVSARTGDDMDPQAASDLQARTGGNPFYVGEIVRLAVSTGTERAMSEGVPDTVRGVIRTRVQQLSSADQTVLRTAAVVGRTFDLDLLAAVAGLDDEAVDEAADRATSVGILRSEPGSPDQHRFTHALLQETLLDETGPSRRARLHRRIAAVLAERHEHAPRPGLSERVAHHLVAAGADADRAGAVQWYLTANDEALERGGYAECRALLESAELAVRRLPAASARTLESAVAGRLRSFQLVTDGVRTMTSGGLDAREVDVQTSERDAVTLLTARWGDAHARNDMAESERVSAEMLRRGDERDSDLLRLGGLMSRGLNQLQRGRPVEAGEDFAAMDPLLPHVTIPPMIFVPHPAAGGPVWGALAATVRGKHDDSERLYEMSLRRAADLGDPMVATYVLTIGLFRSALRRDAPEVLRHMEEIRRRTADQPLDIIDTYAVLPHAWAVSFADPERGASLASTAMAMMDPVPDMAWRPWFRGLYADLLLRAGQLVAARDSLGAGSAEAADHGVALYDGYFHELRARIMHADGVDLDHVVAEIDAGVAVAKEQGAGLFLGFLEDLRTQVA